MKFIQDRNTLVDYYTLAIENTKKNIATYTGIIKDFKEKSSKGDVDTESLYRNGR